MKCLDCNTNESTEESCWCDNCKKIRDDKWKTCRYCGHKEDSVRDNNWVMDSECRKCRKKNKDAYDFKEAQKDGRVRRDDSIMCPYCGYILEDDIYEYTRDSTFTCPECEKKSDMSVESTMHFTTSKVEDDKM